ncbi:isoprenyl transferase [Sphingobacteriaceae bacterium WQ 2009]|uniref:Isoprenyl transferase n=1 Tax=Rhinopithecimicrobium faecis TaxID=2820698 RepID=A0A8T4HAJ9_9SPHI|nr:isoprenyl transferase [Sphingobacteriaceae bacterium WQ 2009]
MSILDQIDTNKLPQHVAVIMDGNGRWAKEKGKLRIFGHQSGVKAVRQTLEAALELGVEYLTLYAFSSENWNRPKLEVLALMELLVVTLNKEVKNFMKNGVRVNAIGSLSQLPKSAQNKLQEVINATQHNRTCTLTIALSYSSKMEIVDATKNIVNAVLAGTLRAEDITEETITNNLYTANIPNPDLLIRTSGEHRISNFLLWQIAYAELYFSPVMWPEFTTEHFYQAVLDYQARERRFGKTSEQL